jgi:hypothetical protein
MSYRREKQLAAVLTMPAKLQHEFERSAQRRVAPLIGSQALRLDSYQRIICTQLRVASLIGLPKPNRSMEALTQELIEAALECQGRCYLG